MEALTSNIQDWGITILQVLISACGLFYGIVELKKEFRKRQNVARKEAIKLRWILISVFGLSIILSIVQNYKSLEDNHDDKAKAAKLQSQITLISKKNDTLKSDLLVAANALSTKIFDSRDTLLSNAAKKSLEASNELNKSTERIEEAVFGGKDYLYLRAYATNDTTFGFALLNDFDKPQYDVGVNMFFYSKVEGCEIFPVKGKMMKDKDCMDKAYINTPDRAINKNSKNYYPNFIYPAKDVPIRVYFVIWSRNHHYTQQYFLGFQGEGFRILKTIKGKEVVMKEHLFKGSVNWKKEFKESLGWNLAPKILRDKR